MAEKEAIFATGTVLAEGTVGQDEESVTSPQTVARVLSITPPSIKLETKEVKLLDSAETEQYAIRYSYGEATFTVQTNQAEYSGWVTKAKALTKVGFTVTYPSGGGVDTLIGYISNLEKGGVEPDGILECTLTVLPTYFATAAGS